MIWFTCLVSKRVKNLVVPLRLDQFISVRNGSDNMCVIFSKKKLFSTKYPQRPQVARVSPGGPGEEVAAEDLAAAVRWRVWWPQGLRVPAPDHLQASVVTNLSVCSNTRIVWIVLSELIRTHICFWAEYVWYSVFDTFYKTKYIR